MVNLFQKLFPRSQALPHLFLVPPPRRDVVDDADRAPIVAREFEEVVPDALDLAERINPRREACLGGFRRDGRDQRDTPTFYRKQMD